MPLSPTLLPMQQLLDDRSAPTPLAEEIKSDSYMQSSPENEVQVTPRSSQLDKMDKERARLRSLEGGGGSTEDRVSDDALLREAYSFLQSGASSASLNPQELQAQLMRGFSSRHSVVTTDSISLNEWHHVQNQTYHRPQHQQLPISSSNQNQNSSYAYSTPIHLQSHYAPTVGSASHARGASNYDRSAMGAAGPEGDETISLATGNDLAFALAQQQQQQHQQHHHHHQQQQSLLPSQSPPMQFSYGQSPLFSSSHQQQQQAPQQAAVQHQTTNLKSEKEATSDNIPQTSQMAPNSSPVGSPLANPLMPIPSYSGSNMFSTLISNLPNRTWKSRCLDYDRLRALVHKLIHLEQQVQKRMSEEAGMDTTDGNNMNVSENLSRSSKMFWCIVSSEWDKVSNFVVEQEQIVSKSLQEWLQMCTFQHKSIIQAKLQQQRATTDAAAAAANPGNSESNSGSSSALASGLGSSDNSSRTPTTDEENPRKRSKHQEQNDPSTSMDDPDAAAKQSPPSSPSTPASLARTFTHLLKQLVQQSKSASTSPGGSGEGGNSPSMDSNPNVGSVPVAAAAAVNISGEGTIIHLRGGAGEASPSSSALEIHSEMDLLLCRKFLSIATLSDYLRQFVFLNYTSLWRLLRKYAVHTKKNQDIQTIWEQLLEGGSQNANFPGRIFSELWHRLNAVSEKMFLSGLIKLTHAFKLDQRALPLSDVPLSTLASYNDALHIASDKLDPPLGELSPKAVATVASAVVAAGAEAASSSTILKKKSMIFDACHLCDDEIACPIRLPCSHRFCFADWMSSPSCGAICPICRFELKGHQDSEIFMGWMQGLSLLHLQKQQRLRLMEVERGEMVMLQNQLERSRVEQQQQHQQQHSQPHSQLHPQQLASMSGRYGSDDSNAAQNLRTMQEPGMMHTISYAPMSQQPPHPSMFEGQHMVDPSSSQFTNSLPPSVAQSQAQAHAHAAGKKRGIDAMKDASHQQMSHNNSPRLVTLGPSANSQQAMKATSISSPSVSASRARDSENDMELMMKSINAVQSAQHAHNGVNDMLSPQQEDRGTSSAHGKSEEGNMSSAMANAANGGLKRGQGYSCHHCKTTKPVPELFLCTSRTPSTMMSAGGISIPSSKRCRKKYCCACMKRLYSPEWLVKDLTGVFAHTEGGYGWQCPSCSRSCVCAGCERKAAGVDIVPPKKKKLAPAAAADSSSSSFPARDDQQWSSQDEGVEMDTSYQADSSNHAAAKPGRVGSRRRGQVRQTQPPPGMMYQSHPQMQMAPYSQYPGAQSHQQMPMHQQQSQHYHPSAHAVQGGGMPRYESDHAGYSNTSAPYYRQMGQSQMEHFNYDKNASSSASYRQPAYHQQSHMYSPQPYQPSQSSNYGPSNGYVPQQQQQMESQMNWSQNLSSSPPVQRTYAHHQHSSPPAPQTPHCNNSPYMSGGPSQYYQQ